MRAAVSLQASFVIVFILFLCWDFVVNGPKAANRAAILADEFHKLQPPDFASPGALSKFSKPGLAGVSLRYRTAAKCPDVFAWYDAELGRHGWTFARLYSRPDWIERKYAKADYFTYVTCPCGVWEYEISLHWSGPMRDIDGLLLFLAITAFVWIAVIVLFRFWRHGELWKAWG
jgi:hypothetical protein